MEYDFHGRMVMSVETHPRRLGKGFAQCLGHARMALRKPMKEQVGPVHLASPFAVPASANARAKLVGHSNAWFSTAASRTPAFLQLQPASIDRLLLI
jgi:hypothetical protein